MRIQISLFSLSFLWEIKIIQCHKKWRLSYIGQIFANKKKFILFKKVYLNHVLIITKNLHCIFIRTGDFIRFTLVLKCSSIIILEHVEQLEFFFFLIVQFQLSFLKLSERPAWICSYDILNFWTKFKLYILYNFTFNFIIFDRNIVIGCRSQGIVKIL